MFACLAPGGTRKCSSLTGLISMPKHPLCPAVPQLIVLGFGINNIYFSKSHHYRSLNLFLSVCFSVISLFSLSLVPVFGFHSSLSSCSAFFFFSFGFIQVLPLCLLKNLRLCSFDFFCLPALFLFLKLAVINECLSVSCLIQHALN